MNAPKCEASDYIDFLVAAQKVFSCTEAARAQPVDPQAAAHDALTRLLHRLEPAELGEALWREAALQVRWQGGLLVLDDSTLDKFYARKIALVHRHWSGKHHRVVEGINLLTLLWSDGDRHVPCDFRLYDAPHDGLTKNDHFRALLEVAAGRGFAPECVAFDSWYSSLENLKAVRAQGWRWLTRLKANRQVDPDGSGNRSLGDTDIAESGTRTHLKGYGWIKVFRLVAPDGDTQHWATGDLEMDELTRLKWAEWSWTIEAYHRGLKQFCGVEKCQARAGRAQRNHVALALRAFVRLEVYCFHTGISWFEAKARIVRDAIRAYLAAPLYNLPSTA